MYVENFLMGTRENTCHVLLILTFIPVTPGLLLFRVDFAFSAKIILFSIHALKQSPLDLVANMINGGSALTIPAILSKPFSVMY